MKRLIAFMCAAAMLLGICTSASAAFEWTSDLTGEFSVYEDFASDTRVNIKNHPNWTKAGTQSPYFIDGVMYMLSNAGDPKNTEATRTFTAISNTKVAVDFDIQVNAGGYFNIFTYPTDKKVSSRIQSTVSNGAPLLQMQAGKDDGSAASAKYTLIDGMEYGRWYSLSMIYDLVNQRVDYYVDNELKYSNARYYNNITLSDISHLLIGANTNSSTSTSFSVRNLKIGELSDLLTMHYDSYNTAPEGLDDVKNDLNLALAGKYGSSVSWSSSNEAVISPGGKVDITKAKGGAAGETVTLTATYSLNGETYKRSFDAMVYGVDEEEEVFFDDFTSDKAISAVSNQNTDATVEKANVDGKSAIHINAPEGSKGEVKITGRLDAPAPQKVIAEMEYKTDAQNVNLMFLQENTTGQSIGRLIAENGKVVWKGNGTVVVSETIDDGWHNVKVLVDTQSDNVCLYYDNVLVINDLGFRAGASGNELIEYISLFNPDANQYGNLYIDYVKIYVPTNQDIADLVAGSINVPETTATNVSLPTTGSWGAEITWESYAEDYITADGVIVSRPAVGDSAYPAELEATVTYGFGTSYASKFIDILPYDEIEYTYTVTDQNGANATSLEGVSTVNLKLNMDINTGDKLDMFVSVAAYDESGKLVAVGLDSKTLSGRNNVLTSSIDLSNADASYVKCFIWENQTPYAVITPIQ